MKQIIINLIVVNKRKVYKVAIYTMNYDTKKNWLVSWTDERKKH